MEEGELEEVRKQRLAEKQKELEARQIEKQLKDALRAALTEPAYERMANVSLANKELYLSAAQQVLHAYKRLRRQINESELLSVLRALRESTEKEGKITFHKK